MSKWIKLAWRDIWRNRRRTLLTMSAIVFSCLLIGLANSVQYGTYDAMEELSVKLFPGEIQIHRAGYHDEQSFENSLQDAEYDWGSLTGSHPWLTDATRRITGFGLVSSDSSSAGSMIVGIEPDNEKRITTFSQNVIAGDVLTPEDRQNVLVGYGLAENLGLGVGDSIVVLTQGYQNAMGADIYRIKGLTRVGTPELDRGLIILPFPDAAYLFNMEGRFTELILKTSNFRNATDYAALLKTTFPEAQYEVMPWIEMLEDIQQTRALDDAGNMIFYMFLVLLIGFEIFNTTMMSVMERVREFGVMMSIGMKHGQISLIIILGLLIKVMLSLLLGMFITWIIVFFLKENPIPLSDDMMQMYEDLGFAIEGISFSARPVVFLFPFVSVSLVALLSMIYPVVKMRTFSPVDALRTG